MRYGLPLAIILLLILSACTGEQAHTTNTNTITEQTINTDSLISADGVIVPAPGGSEAYALGQAVYEQHCAECHGINGEGQFPEAPLQPDDTGRIGAPPHDDTGHTWHHDDALLIRYVVEGGMGDPNSFYPMPALGNVLSEDETIAVIAYIKTMWSPQSLRVQRERTLAGRSQ